MPFAAPTGVEAAPGLLPASAHQSVATLSFPAVLLLSLTMDHPFSDKATPGVGTAIIQNR